MGLDQAIMRMTPETAEKLGVQQDGSLSDEEYGSVKEVWSGRKENHIHAVVRLLTGTEPENCGYTFLTKEQVQDIMSRLYLVNEDHAMAAALLPGQDGFFFGGTERDECFFSSVEDELEAFTEIVKSWDEDSRYAYWCWW